MNSKIHSLIILLCLISTMTFGQVTEGEKKLRSITADTTLGWKKEVYLL